MKIKNMIACVIAGVLTYTSFGTQILSELCSKKNMALEAYAGETDFYISNYSYVDNYVADCLSKGIIDPETGEASPSGPVVYKSALSHNYTYERLAEELMEDEVLLDISNVWTLWDSACSGDFSNLSETQLYEALIMDYLAYETQSAEYKSDFETKTAKYAWDIYDNMLEEVVANAEYLNIAEVFDRADLDVVKQAVKDAGFAEKIKKYTGLVSTLNDIGTDTYDYFNKLSQALALQEANESRVEFLLAIKKSASDNKYLCAAIDDIINKMESSYDDIKYNQGISSMLSCSVSKAWDAISGSVPGFSGIKLGVNGLDLLFNSNDTAVNNTKLLLLYTLDQYAKQALIKNNTKYVSNPTKYNAVILNDSFESYINYQKYATNWARTFVSDITFEGMFNKIKNIFSDKNQATYEKFMKMFDDDVDFCDREVDFLGGWENIYNKAVGFENILNNGSINTNQSQLINKTVDINYNTPWKGQPKAQSGVIKVYNKYGTAYESNVRNIAYNDTCTVHEVYTSGFCKVTYPTSNGTHTEYAKASDFNIPKKSIINTTVDTSYATPWNGEPKATTGLITVYNEYGTAYASNVRNIAHNDTCTVHEVYTSGFCKVSYPTSNGTHTEYAKASDFNIPKKSINKINTTVDTSYATPWNGEPKATTGLITVYNEYGTAYASNVRNIAHNDACTVHEVYTSGFCKVSYPTSNGTHTEYAKASDFNIPKNTNNKPLGVLDEYSGGTGSVFVRGWGFDKDNTSASLDVHVYVWNVNALNTPMCVGGIKADKSREDVNKVYGCGNNHGFEARITTNLPTGEYQIKAALLDTEGGDATWLEGGKIKVTADTTAPTISSVTISDVTINGYKVTVKASDNVGVSKVAIPTWTDKNGQDDLFADWANTALATKVNDTTWTYNVKVSDHQNELGWYNTDIYVYDIAGNIVKHSSSNSKRYRTQVGVYVRKLDLDGGSCSKTSVTVTYGQKIGALPTPTKTGYTFVGWYTEKTAGGIVNADTVIKVAADAWLYARWKANTYTRKLELDGGNCSKTSITVTYGQKVGTLPVPTKEGYVFDGWYTAATGGSKVTSDWVVGHAGDGSLYARWKAVTTTTKATTTTTKATTTTTKPTTTTTQPTTTTTKPTTTTTSTITTTVPVITTRPDDVINDGDTAIIISDVKAETGETVDIYVDLRNNPGIASLGFELYYDPECLEFVNSINGTVMGDSFYECVNSKNNSIIVQWLNFNNNITESGTILVLTFKVLDDAATDSTKIEISYKNDDIKNLEEQTVPIKIKSGNIIISSKNIISGDVNNDGVVDLKDVILIRRFIVGGWDVDIDTDTADVNADGVVDLKDVILIRRFIAGGWDVELV